MKLTFERKLPIVLFFVFLMMATIGVVFYQNTVSLQDAIALEKRSQAVILSLENMMTFVLEAETEMRAFADTGNTTYLDQYDRSRRNVDRSLALVKQRFNENTSQKEELQRLESTLTEFWKVAGERIERRKQMGAAARDIDVSYQDTRVLLNNIRNSSDNLKTAETASMREKDAYLEASLKWTIWILIVTSLAGLISLGIANVLVWSEGRKRTVAEKKLIEANLDLERTVDSRTEELRKVNDELRVAAEDRELLLEKERMAREEAEIANRLRDEFMATVSHELRTPLNSILGWARLMKDGTLGPEQVEKAVSTIIKNSEAQNRLIEDLLDVARIISGKLKIENEPVRIDEVIRHTVESVLPSAESRNIDLSVEISENINDLEITGDKGRLEQIFSNLLTNALKFTPEGGAVDISADKDNEMIEIAVRDNGVGISPEFLPLVFERFRQNVNNEKKDGGLGLGLAIVRNLVEMHGGTVMASSEGVDKGAVFVVCLPVDGKNMKDVS